MEDMIRSEELERPEVQDTEKASGKVHISEDVVTELARWALSKVPGIQPATAGIASKLGLGRKVTEGVKVSMDEGNSPTISVDAFLMVKYGLRIPDLAWDVQETVKNELESMTGYVVNSVNVYVQGVYFKDPKAETPDDEPSLPDKTDPSSGKDESEDGPFDALPDDQV